MKRRAGREILEQKGIIIGIAVLFMVGCLAVLPLDSGDERYSIRGQFSFGGGEYRETVMNVVVGRNARVEDVGDEIIKEHLRVNADNRSDKITLRLYRSEWALQHGICFKELFYVT